MDMQVDPKAARTILLVEDEDVVRSLARRILERDGYQVIEARTGDEAIDASARFGGSIQLILSDVVMPEMSGKEVAERIAFGRPETKILYMSGFTAHVIARHGVLEPGIELIEKPFTADALTARVRQVLDS